MSYSVTKQCIPMNKIIISLCVAIISTGVSYSQSNVWIQTEIGAGSYVNSFLAVGDKVFASQHHPENILYETSNDGLHWQAAVTGTSGLVFSDFAKDSSGICYAAGVSTSGNKFNGIYRSMNEGDTWTKIFAFDSSKYFNNIYDIQINKIGVVFATVRKTSDSSVVIKLTQNASKWSVVKANKFKSNNCQQLAIDVNDNLYLTISGSEEGGLYSSSDNGDTWNYMVEGLNSIPNRIYCAAAKILALTYDALYVADNIGGKFFEMGSDLYGKSVTELLVTSNRHVVCVGQFGAYYSTDMNNFFSINSGLHHFYLSGIVETKNGVLLCSANGGGVYRLGSVNSASNKVSNNIMIISPNPSTIFSSINYTLDKPSFVTSSLVDIRGKVVKQQMKSWMDAGSHEMQLDVSDLPNGVYTALLRTNDELMTAKLVVSR
jgi:photosystem II stability/assembly factor-like uncharacterized protein